MKRALHVEYSFSINLAIFEISEAKWAIPRLLMSFCNKLICLRWRVFSPTPNPQVRGQPLTGCPRLFIQYIRSHPPYLQAVFSIRNLRTPRALVRRDRPTIYKTIILPVVLYGCETWSLALWEGHRLRVFENRVLWGSIWSEERWSEGRFEKTA
jgi:hypothetical protein